MQQEDLLSINSEHRIRSENLAFDIDVWYPRLKSFTFETRFIAFSRPEAKAIIRYQDYRFREKANALTEDDIVELRSLEERIDGAIRRHFHGTGAFIRLCGRSPKDAEPLDREVRVRRPYTTALQSLVDRGEPLDANTKMRAISRVNYLRVESGSEAMSLLLTSERVFTDLHDWIRWGEPEQVVLRRFEPDLTQQFEFRAFVNNGTLNAISQYDHYCIYPELGPLKDRIQQGIMECWHRVHPHVGVDSYIIDFGYLPGSAEVVVIELSPFLDCTGTACFSWRCDRHILENGPFQFRINEKLPPYLDQLVEANWELRWQGQLPHYSHFYRFHSPRSTPSSSPSLSDILMYGSLVSFVPAYFLLYRRRTTRISLGVTVGALSIVSVISLLRRCIGSDPGSHTHLMFFYGTLRSLYHWSEKFLSRSKMVGKARSTTPLPLVVGECGVPYVLDQEGGEHIVGELWEVDAATLENLDEYEGVGKGYYQRKQVRVQDLESGKIHHAQIYVKAQASSKLSKGPFIPEYTIDIHRQHYNPIKHILVKQMAYLNDVAGKDKT